MNLTISAAGSLRNALPAMISAVGLRADIHFGPAGLLRRRIEEGERPDLFFSASMHHARAIAALADYGSACEFAENRLCLFGRQAALSGDDALAAMLNPENRLGTSTPGADPGGDYAFAVFDKAEAILPGSRDRLRAKALPLVGGNIPTEKGAAPSPVVGLFKSGQVDIFLGYRTSALDMLQAVDGLRMLELPPELAVKAVYGAVALKKHAGAAEALDLLRSDMACDALETAGFSRVPLCGTSQEKRDG